MDKIPVINQIIKDKRKELKITQEDFTKIINKGISTVRRYDTGDIIPENTLILICDKLNLNFYDLLKKQIEENRKFKIKNYDKLILKYQHDLLFFGLKEISARMTETEEERKNNARISVLNDICTKLNNLYSILYDEFYYNLDRIEQNEENRTIKNKKYIAEMNLKKDKILIKEIKTFLNDEKEEKYIDVFPIDNYIFLLKELKEYFNIKLSVMRKEKLIPKNDFINTLGKILK